MLPPKYLYDERGSELFEEITQLPEYYPTRTERSLLQGPVTAWLRESAPCSLVELGAGSAEKTRILLDALVAAHGAGVVYAPLDVSADFLSATAQRMQALYPSLDVRPIVADLAADFRLPHDLPRPIVVAFLGSTIGNFEEQEAVRLLTRASRGLRTGDHLLLGVDLAKDAAVVNAAYNDSRGLTSAFNLNVLRVLNRELGADFDIEAFEHRAAYDVGAGRVEMHLLATRPMRVSIPEVGEFELERGESIRTEISRKHERAEVESMLEQAELQLAHWWQADLPYAVLLASRSVH